MSQSLSQLYTHIVFHVNLSNGIMIPEKLQPVLHAYLATVCKNHDSPSILVGGTNDHVHILNRISKNIAPVKLIEEIKTDSSRWMKTQAQDYGLMLSKFSWQKGYGIFSVSSSHVEVVRNYIANQVEHHKKRSFKEEYILFLEKHGVEYDEKYLWN